MKKKPSLSDSSVVVAEKRLTSTKVDGESVILDLEEDIYYGLNPTGSRIWNQIQEPTAIKSVVKKISKKYDVEKEKCTRETISLIEDMIEKNLARVEK